MIIKAIAEIATSRIPPATGHPLHWCCEVICFTIRIRMAITASAAMMSNAAGAIHPGS